MMKLSKRLGSFAIVLDEASELTEMIVTDEIELFTFLLNHEAGLAQFAFVFGGRDKRGQFHMDHSRGADIAQLTISRQQNPDIYRKYFDDDQGNPTWDLEYGTFVELFALLIPAAYQQIWSKKYPDLEVTLDEDDVILAKK